MAAPANALPKTRRVRKRAEYLRAQRSPHRCTSAHFVFLVVSGPRPPAPARLGVVVTRKLGGAVARNRVKRLCRECFRQWPSLLPNGVDVVVIARGGADGLGLADVRREWEGVVPQLRRGVQQALARAAEPTHVSRRNA